RNLGLRRFESATDLQISAVGKRQEIGERARHDREPVLDEPQITDHLRIEQAYRVARRRIAESRMEFFRDGGTAQHASPFEDANLDPGAGEIGGAGQTVVTAADDDDVEARSGSRLPASLTLGLRTQHRHATLQLSASLARSRTPPFGPALDLRSRAARLLVHH